MLSEKDRYVSCIDCGCRREFNGVCEICGHVDVPLLPGMVPDITGMQQELANAVLTNPEAQLKLGNVETAHNDTIAVDLVIASDPEAGTQLEIGDSVDIIVSLGPE